MLSFRFSTVLALAMTSSTVFAATDIAASSRLGRRLLSAAQPVNFRELNNNNNDEVDYTWVADYSIRFDSCHTTLAFRADAGNSADEEDGAPTESMRLVHFKLCPTDSCDGKCQHGADYLVEMREFVEAYLEFQMTQQEYNCEQVENNCDCENANDDQACLADCYTAAGLDYCQEDENNYNNNQNGNNDFELDRYLECARLNDNADDGYSSSAIYVGAYCAANGKAIYLGTFSDRSCTQFTNSNTFKTYTGYDLPYTSESIVSNECLSCREPAEYDDDNYYNQDRQDEDEVIEMCEELYQRSAKCEGNLQNNAAQQYTGGCDFMNKQLPAFEKLAAGKGGASSATIWACVFAVTTALLAVYAAFLYRRITRLSNNKVNLSSQ